MLVLERVKSVLDAEMEGIDIGLAGMGEGASNPAGLSVGDGCLTEADSGARVRECTLADMGAGAGKGSGGVRLSSAVTAGRGDGGSRSGT